MSHRTAPADPPTSGPGAVPDAAPGLPQTGRGRVVMQVRWSDVDLFGHVNNAAFLRFLDDARFTLFPLMGVDEVGAMTASRLVVVKHEIDYLAPIRFRPAPVVVEVWVPRLGRSSVDFAYEVLDGEAPGATVALRARSRMVQLDHETHTPRPFTDEERATFAAYPGPSPELHPW
ncbi:acyl-CoA thioesterase [Cellulomonas wangsupingiae]|uniref:Acyl-CoA thioesterase n=1 Tax=Cellulomonas wangsupingiae TaxID=2968085 RepID=A0ABY5K2J3_9CELL|nr:thioesterase family protein [Cellulomonas wangsupingiae]MCC2336455.1 acyl-CoA thioesterase [Cellulomonas wangsupingiae]MCM0640855.1 acyl-CoA thioesterase [Cellulomonas wangsupingiae]UUI64667.1 acyl-CoA thioesterase [Cellulomonas wangsupingiae]